MEAVTSDALSDRERAAVEVAYAWHRALKPFRDFDICKAVTQSLGGEHIRSIPACSYACGYLAGQDSRNDLLRHAVQRNHEHSPHACSVCAAIDAALRSEMAHG